VGGWALKLGKSSVATHCIGWQQTAVHTYKRCQHCKRVCDVPGNCVATEERLTSFLQCWLCWRWVQTAVVSLLCLFLLAWLPCRPEPWRSAPQTGAQPQQAAPAAQESREQGSAPVRKTAPKIAPVSGDAVCLTAAFHAGCHLVLVPADVDPQPAATASHSNVKERKKDRVLVTCLSVCRQTRRLSRFVPSQCNCSPASSNVPCTRRRQPSLQPRQLHSWRRQRRRQCRSLG
jgi:hypothetical protein